MSSVTDASYTVKLSGGGDFAVLTRPGDFVTLRALESSSVWNVVATNCREAYSTVSSSTHNVTDVDGLFLVDTSSNSVTLSLPDLTAVQRIRGPVKFIKTSASNTMTIDTAGSETILDGTSGAVASVSATALGSVYEIAVHNQAYYVTAKI